MSRKAYSPEERETLRSNMLARSASIFAEKGLRNTNLEDIYVPEGISKTFFYTFFPSKASLIGEVFRMQSKDILDTLTRNVWEYGSVNGMRETLKDVVAGRWFISTFDDQNYVRDLLSDEEFIGFKNDRIVLFADILNIVGIPVSRLDPRVFYNMLMSVVWTCRSNQSSLPFLYGEVIRTSSEIQIGRLVDYLASLRVDAEIGEHRVSGDLDE